MNNKIKNKEIEKVLRTAERYMKQENYIGAMLYYSDVFRFHQKEYYHKAYFGLYLAWWNSCRYNNKWDTFIDKFFKNAILNAPSHKQEEYHKIYNENNKIFHKEDLEDE